MEGATGVQTQDTGPKAFRVSPSTLWFTGGCARSMRPSSCPAVYEGAGRKEVGMKARGQDWDSWRTRPRLGLKGQKRGCRGVGNGGQGCQWVRVKESQG